MIRPLENNSVSLSSTKSSQPTSKFSFAQLSTQQSAPKNSTSVSLSSPQTLSDLRKKFDVTDLTNREVSALSLDLKNKGLISAFEAANLSLAIVPVGGTFDPDARVNLVKQVQNQLEFSKQFSSTEQSQSLPDVLKVLRDLQKT